MLKIASPQELQAELRAILAFVHTSEKPDRQVIASKLRAVAARLTEARVGLYSVAKVLNKALKGKGAIARVKGSTLQLAPDLDGGRIAKTIIEALKADGWEPDDAGWGLMSDFTKDGQTLAHGDNDTWTLT